jgi:hypothetical protein
MKWPTRLNPVPAAVLFAGLYTGTDPLPAAAQAPLASTTGPQAGSFLLTVFLRHDETKTVDQINE